MPITGVGFESHFIVGQIPQDIDDSAYQPKPAFFSLQAQLK